MSNDLQRADDADDTPASRADDATATALTVELWTRRPVCGPRTTVIDRLSALRTKGTLAEFTVELWPDEIAVEQPGDNDILDTVDRFEAWAADNGVTVRPPFETRTASSLIGESERVLVTPMLLAAVYDGDELAAVYPCTDGDDTWTVEAFLDALDPEASTPDGERQPFPGPVTGG